MTILGNTIFKNKNKLKKEYGIKEENKKLVNEYITPIWNDKNFDQVLYDSKLISRIPNYKEKGKMYRGIFYKNNGQADIDCIRELLYSFENNPKTNMNILIEKCLEGLQKFN